MTNDLLVELEKKITGMVDHIEILQLELQEEREKNLKYEELYNEHVGLKENVDSLRDNGQRLENINQDLMYEKQQALEKLRCLVEQTRQIDDMLTTTLNKAPKKIFSVSDVETVSAQASLNDEESIQAQVAKEENPYLAQLSKAKPFAG